MCLIVLMTPLLMVPELRMFSICFCNCPCLTSPEDATLMKPETSDDREKGKAVTAQLGELQEVPYWTSIYHPTQLLVVGLM